MKKVQLCEASKKAKINIYEFFFEQSSPKDTRRGGRKTLISAKLLILVTLLLPRRYTDVT